MRLLLVLATLGLMAGCGGPDDWESRLQTAAADLLKVKTISYNSENANRPVKDIVNVGPGLAQVLKTRTAAIEDLEIKVANMDLFNKPRFGWLSEAWDFVSTAGGYERRVRRPLRADVANCVQEIVVRQGVRWRNKGRGGWIP